MGGEIQLGHPVGQVGDTLWGSRRECGRGGRVVVYVAGYPGEFEAVGVGVHVEAG
jgi:hypothetical protein